MSALDPDDLRRLTQLASGRGHTGTRNRALVTAFAGAGLGVSEALALTAADVDEEGRSVTVSAGRARRIAVEEQALTPLLAWAQERRALGLSDEGPLFCTREGLALEASYVRRLVARLGREAGVAGVVNARSLRESYAARRIAAGASPDELKAELGHTSIASTQRYVRQLGPQVVPTGGPLPPGILEGLLATAHCGLAVLRGVRNSAGTIEDFVIDYVNPAAAGLMGFAPDVLPGSSVTERFPNSPTDGTYARWIGLIETQGRGGENRVHEAEGRSRLFRVRRAAIGDRVLMSFDDLGAVRGAERALALAEAQHAAILDGADAGILLLDEEGTITSANPAAAGILGVSLDRLVGLAPSDPRWRALDESGEPVPPNRLPAVVTRTTGEPQRERVLGVLDPYGRTIWTSANTQAVETEGGPPYPVVAVLTDLAPQRRLEARARAAEEAMSLACAAVGGFLLHCRPDGTILSASAGVTEMLGHDPKDMVGTNCHDAVAAADVANVQAAYLEAMDGEDTVHLAHGLRHAAGARIDVTRSLRAVRDPTTGKIDEVLSLILPT